jgi:hypothetical protein
MKKLVAFTLCLVLVVTAFFGGYHFAIHSVKGAMQTKDGYAVDFNGQLYDYFG